RWRHKRNVNALSIDADLEARFACNRPRNIEIRSFRYQRIISDDSAGYEITGADLFAQVFGIGKLIHGLLIDFAWNHRKHNVPFQRNARPPDGIGGHHERRHRAFIVDDALADY